MWKHAVARTFVAVLAAIGLLAVGTPAVQAQPGSTSASHIVASGPGYVLVGEGARVRTSGPLTVTIDVTANAVAPMSVTNCGYASCSLYLSREQTRWFNSNLAAAGGVLATGAAFCGLASLISGMGAVFVGIGCVAFWALYGGFLMNAVSRAAASNACLRIRYGALGFGFYSDNSGYCRNT